MFSITDKAMEEAADSMGSQQAHETQMRFQQACEGPGLPGRMAAHDGLSTTERRERLDRVSRLGKGKAKELESAWDLDEDTPYSRASTSYPSRSAVIDEIARALVLLSGISEWGETAIAEHGSARMWEIIQPTISEPRLLSRRQIPTLFARLGPIGRVGVKQLRVEIFNAFYQQVQDLLNREGLQRELGRCDKLSAFWDTESLRSELSLLLHLCHSLQDRLYQQCADTQAYFQATIGFFQEQQKAVEFVIELDILRYCKTEFPNQSRVDLSTVVTLTGTALYAYASTCGEYLKQITDTTWGLLAIPMLNLLQQALDQLMNRDDIDHIKVEHKFPLREIGDATIGISFILWRSGQLEVKLLGSLQGSPVPIFNTEVISTAARILSWLMIAFSSLPYEKESVVYCYPIIEKKATDHKSMHSFYLSRKFYQMHPSENSCWHSLFSNAAIALGFDIPDRHEGQGLEISMDLMASIIGARHAATYDGGVVMKGHSSMLLPVRRTVRLDMKEGMVYDGIQWHYLANDDPDEPLSYAEGVGRCPGRALEGTIALSQIGKETRCFIGWTADAKLDLGNPRCDYENIDFSKASEVKSTIQVSGGAVGFQQFGCAQMNVTFGKKDGKCHFQRSSSYRRVVMAADRSPVALFDTGQRRGWLLPASGVLLHMVRHRVHLGHIDQLPIVESTRDYIAGASFKDMLLKHGRLKVSVDECSPLHLDEVVTEIWSVLELLQAQQAVADKSEKQQVHATWQDIAYGYEYRAIVEDHSPLAFKETEIRKTSGGWTQLAKDIDALVLFASGFEDLIRPVSDESSLCSEWRGLPWGKDYMATTVTVILDLYSMAGSKLDKARLTSTNLQLHGQGESFGLCPKAKGRPCQCERLHRIVSMPFLGTICVPNLDGNEASQGAIIIGRSNVPSESSKSRPAASQMQLFSQPNIGFDIRDMEKGRSPSILRGKRRASNSFAIRELSKLEHLCPGRTESSSKDNEQPENRSTKSTGPGLTASYPTAFLSELRNQQHTERI